MNHELWFIDQLMGLLYNTSKMYLLEIPKILPMSFEALLLIFVSQNEIRPMVKKGSRFGERNCGTASPLR